MKLCTLLLASTLLCAMSSTFALTSKAEGGHDSYSFFDQSKNEIATLKFTNSRDKLYFSFIESSSHLGDATSLSITYEGKGKGRDKQNEYKNTTLTFALGAGNDVISSTLLGGKDAEFKSAMLRYTPAVSAVPEPETYTTLLAGLGLMGAIARRRKAKQG